MPAAPTPGEGLRPPASGVPSSEDIANQTRREGFGEPGGLETAASAAIAEACEAPHPKRPRTPDTSYIADLTEQPYDPWLRILDF